MKAFHITANSLGDILLYWIILFANIDYNGIIDYGLKAFVGGAIWFGFKLAADYYSRKFKTNFTEQKNGEE